MIRGHVKVNMAVFAPIPSARERTTTAVNTGLFRIAQRVPNILLEKSQVHDASPNCYEVSRNICEPTLFPKEH